MGNLLQPMMSWSFLCVCPELLDFFNCASWWLSRVEMGVWSVLMHFECSFLVSMCINICMRGRPLRHSGPVCFDFSGLVSMRLTVVIRCVQSLSVAPVDCIPLLSTCGTNLTKHSEAGAQMEKNGTSCFITLQNNNLTRGGGVLFSQLCHQSCFDYAQ